MSLAACLLTLLAYHSYQGARPTAVHPWESVLLSGCLAYWQGVKLSDSEGLDSLRLSRHELAQLLISAFSVMVFSGGFVHCDPHPGNLLARPDPSASARKGRPVAQLVVLDHGLYRELSHDFRLESPHDARSRMGVKKGISESTTVPFLYPSP